jgi:hypothetical protein
MSDPKTVLKEYGVEFPDGIEVKVVENAEDCVHITLPAAPGGSPALSDDEQSNAAGGCSSLRAGSGGTLELPVPAGLHNG